MSEPAWVVAIGIAFVVVMLLAARALSDKE